MSLDPVVVAPDSPADAVAGVLDAHGQWLRTAGREGKRADLRGRSLAGMDLSGVDLREAELRDVELRGADLRHADLRGANLRHGDLRESRLEGARLQESWLDFADLRGAVNLLPEQLAGAHASGARLPAEWAGFAGLDHVQELIIGGRKVFFMLLLAVGYTWLSLATTTDVALLINAATAPLPIILTELPIAGFFWSAPLILLGFYAYFTLHLQRLWEGLANLPAVFPDGRSVEDKALPWLLTGLVNAHFRCLRDSRPPMSRVQNAIVIVLIWYLIPVTLAALWLRYLPRHDPWGTGFQVLVLMVAAVIGVLFYRLAIRTLRGAGLESPSLRSGRWSNLGRRVAAALGLAATFLAAPLLSHGVIASADDPPGQLDPRHWAPRVLSAFGYLPHAHFQGRDVSPKPTGWRDDVGKPGMISGARLRDTSLHHAQAAEAFLVKADLREADLRFANLELADLRHARLADARLHHASLLQARLEGADLARAGLRNAALLLADLSGADLHQANLQRAFLNQARLAGAELIRADLRGAYLDQADLRGASLDLARLEGVSLVGTDLRGVDLAQVTGLDCEKLAMARSDADTRLPEGLNCP